MKTGILKAYKNGQANILISKPITKEYTVTNFHIERCDTIDRLKNDYERFETELIEV